MTKPGVDLTRELNVAIDAVLSAWQAIRPLYDGHYDIHQKPDGPVTEADHASNDRILGVLGHHFPDDAVLSEETAPDPSRLEARRVWIIDPIDGTRDFIDKSGNFAIQAGLAVRTETGYRPALGVVYHPLQNHIFYARQGEGAWLREGTDRPRRIAVSNTADLPQMTAVYTRSHRTERFLHLIDDLGPARRVSMGSIGLKVVWVAAARADYYLNNARGMCKEWDICAPEAVLLEAGGRLTHLETGADILYNRSDPTVGGGVLATNNASHERLRERILQTEVRLRRETQRCTHS